MRIAPLGTVLSLTLVAAVLTGCTSSNKNEPLIAAPTSPIADVPVPAGFAMMKEVSTSKVIPASSTRFVDHQYSGSDDFLPVAKFYKDQMPKFKWVLADQSQGDSSVTLHFIKGSEDCYVTINDGSLVKHTHIRVRIDPMARNAAH